MGKESGTRLSAAEEGGVRRAKAIVSGRRRAVPTKCLGKGAKKVFILVVTTSRTILSFFFFLFNASCTVGVEE